MKVPVSLGRHPAAAPCLRELLPPSVACRVLQAATDDQDAWLPITRGAPAEEVAALDPAAALGRRRDFFGGRWCARQAMGDLGTVGPLLRAPDRSPLWPPGLVGSITHTSGYCAAAVAKRCEIGAIGIDVERCRVLAPGFAGSVARAEERHLARDPMLGRCWEILLFSAKESVFKAWYPLAGRWLGFEDAVVSFDQATGTFVARLLVAGPHLDGREVRSFPGRYAIGGGVVVTAVVVPAGAGHSQQGRGVNGAG